jgi:hypothetical protein
MNKLELQKLRGDAARAAMAEIDKQLGLGGDHFRTNSNQSLEEMIQAAVDEALRNHGIMVNNQSSFTPAPPCILNADGQGPLMSQQNFVNNFRNSEDADYDAEEVQTFLRTNYGIEMFAPMPCVLAKD